MVTGGHDLVADTLQTDEAFFVYWLGLFGVLFVVVGREEADQEGGD